jgi:6-phosphofructokinase 1
LHRVNRIGVLTSGGDAPGMNAAVRAIVRKGIYHGLQVVGIRRGFLGLLKKEFVRFSLGSVADIIHRGGTFLHTARCEEFKTEQGQREALKNLQIQSNTWDIDIFLIPQFSPNNNLTLDLCIS